MSRAEHKGGKVHRHRRDGDDSGWFCAGNAEDIDLLIDPSPGNQAAVRQALQILPDKAVNDLREGDLERYVVVRVADEVVVDLLLSAGGIAYAQAQTEAIVVDISGVPIPFASPRLLLRMKETGREKDALDLLFLRELLSKS